MEEGAITADVTDAILGLVKDAPDLFAPDAPHGPRKCHIVMDHTGGAASRVPKDATSYYWRQGSHVVMCCICWESPDQKIEAQAWAERCSAMLTPFSIDKRAAYINYIDEDLEDWEYAYYGENYARLQSVKLDWDPTNLFHFKQSVKPSEQ